MVLYGSQSNADIETLQLKLTQAKNIHEKIDLYNQLSYEMRNASPMKMDSLARVALRL